MSQHTQHECTTSGQSNPPLDIEALRAKLKSGLGKRHAKEDAIRAAMDEASRMAADAAAAVVAVFQGQVRKVEASPTAEGYMIRVDGVPLMRINIPEYFGPNLATYVSVANANRGSIQTCCHAIEDVVRYAIRLATE